MQLKINGLSHNCPVSEGAKLQLTFSTIRVYAALIKNSLDALASGGPSQFAPSKASSLLQPRRGVMSRRLCGTFRCRALTVVLVMGLGCSATAWSQQSAGYSGRSTAIDQANSRAEHEAEQMVSLSADRILYILRDEPGLLLQVKKALVRIAFEQGRILDPKDLTDDALFRLIREDDSIRIIATREIVDRSYVRAKPTREDLARNLPCRQPMPTTSEALAKQPDQSSPDMKRIPSSGRGLLAQARQRLGLLSDSVSSLRHSAIFVWSAPEHPDTVPAAISAVAKPTTAVPPAAIPTAAVSSTTIPAHANSSAGSARRLPPPASVDGDATIPGLLWHGKRPKRDGKHPAR